MFRCLKMVSFFRNAYYARAFADLGMHCGNLAIARGHSQGLAQILAQGWLF
jgi:hypothetical protein